MSLLARISDLVTGRQANRLQELALLIASRSQPAVWQRVATRSMAMRPSEAWGYFRARAASVIHAQVDRTLGSDLATSDRPLLVELATLEVIRATIRQWIQARSIRPIPIEQRAAA